MGNVNPQKVLLENWAKEVFLYIAQVQVNVDDVNLFHAIWNRIKLNPKCLYCKNYNARTPHYPIHAAATRGNIKIILLLLNLGSTISQRDDKLRTPLLVAAGEGRLEACRLFLRHGSSLNERDYQSRTALHQASAFGNTEVVEYLLNLGADREARDEKGMTPLLLAVLGMRINVVTFLLKREADVHAVCNKGNGVLHYAAKTGFYAMVKVLLEAGAKPGILNKARQSPQNFASGADLSCLLTYFSFKFTLSQMLLLHRTERAVLRRKPLPKTSRFRPFFSDSSSGRSTNPTPLIPHSSTSTPNPQNNHNTHSRNDNTTPLISTSSSLLSSSKRNLLSLHGKKPNLLLRESTDYENLYQTPKIHIPEIQLEEVCEVVDLMQEMDRSDTINTDKEKEKFHWTQNKKETSEDEKDSLSNRNIETKETEIKQSDIFLEEIPVIPPPPKLIPEKSKPPIRANLPRMEGTTKQKVSPYDLLQGISKLPSDVQKMILGNIKDNSLRLVKVGE